MFVLIVCVCVCVCVRLFRPACALWTWTRWQWRSQKTCPSSPTPVTCALKFASSLTDTMPFSSKRSRLAANPLLLAMATVVAAREGVSLQTHLALEVTPIHPNAWRFFSRAKPGRKSLIWPRRQVREMLGFCCEKGQPYFMNSKAELCRPRPRNATLMVTEGKVGWWPEEKESRFSWGVHSFTLEYEVSLKDWKKKKKKLFKWVSREAAQLPFLVPLTPTDSSALMTCYLCCPCSTLCAHGSMPGLI